MRIAVLWALLLVAAPIHTLRGDVARVLEMEQVEAKDGLLTVSFRLKTATGLPISDFSVAGLRMEIGDSLLQPLHVDSRPRYLGSNLVLMLDASGSMAGEPLTDAKEAAIEFVRRMRSNDYGRVVGFCEQLSVSTPLTNDQEELVRAIGRIEPLNDTALYDALYESLEYLEKVGRGRKAILVLTDGKDTASALALEDVLEKARGSGVPIYAIGLGSELKPREKRRVLERLSRLSGGQYYAAPSSKDLKGIYGNISEEILDIYVAVFVVPELFQNGSIQRTILRYAAEGIYVKDIVDVLIPSPLPDPNEVAADSPWRPGSDVVVLVVVMVGLAAVGLAALLFWLVMATRSR